MQSRKKCTEISRKHFKKRIKVISRNALIDQQILLRKPELLKTCENSDLPEATTNENECIQIPNINVNSETNNVCEISTETVNISINSASERSYESDKIYDETREINLNPHELTEPILDDEIIQRIAAWNCKHNVSVNCSNEILRLFRDAGHKVPLDIRTVNKM